MRASVCMCVVSWFARPLTTYEGIVKVSNLDYQPLLSSTALAASGVSLNWKWLC